MRIESVQLVRSAAHLEDLPNSDRIEIAVSGRSNVGKSSLLNSLFGGKAQARVSRTPGKTQLLHFFRVNERFHLVDLPGYGYAAVPEAVQRRWRRTMQGYLQRRRQLVGVLQLLDCRHAPSQDDRAMLDWLVAEELRFCLVLTKVDKLKRGERTSAMRRLLQDLELPGDLPLVPHSSVSVEGRNEILAWIETLLGAVPRALPPGH